MKRICFLLTFFLTGFSLIANEQSLRNTYLLACAEEVYEIDLGTKNNEKAGPIEESNLEFKRQPFLKTSDFICFVRK